MPEILDKGFIFDLKKLWSMDIRVEEINISELSHNLDIPYLDKE
jgi:hypothetical protein